MVFEPVVVSQCVEDRRLVVLAPMMLFARLLGLARCSWLLWFSRAWSHWFNFASGWLSTVAWLFRFDFNWGAWFFRAIWWLRGAWQAWFRLTVKPRAVISPRVRSWIARGSLCARLSSSLSASLFAIFEEWDSAAAVSLRLWFRTRWFLRLRFTALSAVWAKRLRAQCAHWRSLFAFFFFYWGTRASFFLLFWTCLRDSFVFWWLLRLELLWFLFMTSLLMLSSLNWSFRLAWLGWWWCAWLCNFGLFVVLLERWVESSRSNWSNNSWCCYWSWCLRCYYVGWSNISCPCSHASIVKFYISNLSKSFSSSDSGKHCKSGFNHFKVMKMAGLWELPDKYNRSITEIRVNE